MARVQTGLTHRQERRELLLLVGDRAELDGGLLVDDRQHRAADLGRQLALLLGRFALAQLLLRVDREQDQLAAVLLQPLDVLLAALDRLVLAARVNGDADGLREALGQTGTLQGKKQERGVWLTSLL